MSKPSKPIKAEPEAAGSQGTPASPVSGLVSLRMVTIFTLLRRREILANRRLFGLTEIEWQIMVYTGDRAPLSLGRLAAATMKDEGQLSRAVKKMVARGLLRRERKPGGPEIEISLSSEGQEIYQRMVERTIARDRSLIAELPTEDLDALWRITDTMLNKARELLGEERDQRS